MLGAIESFWCLKEDCLRRLAAVAAVGSVLRPASGVGSEGLATGVVFGACFCSFLEVAPSPSIRKRVSNARDCIELYPSQRRQPYHLKEGHHLFAPFLELSVA